MSYDSSSQDAGGNNQAISSMKIKTVKRGYSSESDKLLDFLVRSTSPESVIRIEILFNDKGERSI